MVWVFVVFVMFMLRVCCVMVCCWFCSGSVICLIILSWCVGNCGLFVRFVLRKCLMVLCFVCLSGRM